MAIEVIPAILASDRNDFNLKLSAISGCAKKIHLDIIDGIFVSNLTIDGISEVTESNFDGFWDVHLMVSTPIESARRWFKIAEVNNIFVHAGIISVKDFKSLKGEANLLGFDLCIVFDVGIDFNKVIDYIEASDIIQCMTVKSGFYGGEFQKTGIDLAKKILSIYPNKKIIIDGGMNPQTAKLAIEAGASQIVSGGFIMNSDSPCQSLKELQVVI